MQLLVAGVSHHTAPLALRERVALAPHSVPRELDRLVRTGLPEGLILSTCNRTEVYTRRTGDAGARLALDFLGGLAADGAAELREHVYVSEGDEAVAHLFRVAAGLESLVLGEPEIVRQLSDAYALACSAGTAGPLLHRAVPRALQIAKRVRTETGIARGVASVAGASVELAGRVFRDVASCSILAIGAGETVTTALKTLRPRACGRLVVANRTLERAEAVARRFDGAAAPLADVGRLAADADVVVAATASARPLLLAGELVPHLGRRGDRPLLVLDLGVPRNVDPAAGALPGVYLHSIDDLQAIAERGRAERALEVPKAEAIVTSALTEFRRRRRELDAAPAIKALLDGILDIRETALTGERELTESERGAAERVSGRLVDKIMRRIAPRLKDGSLDARNVLDAFGVALPGDETANA